MSQVKSSQAYIDEARAKVLVEKWAPVLDYSSSNVKAIDDDHTRLNTAILLENQEQWCLKENYNTAKLAGGVAVIRVGGATEIEVKEKRDRVEDAMNATRAAVEEGIVPGGGTALLYATKSLDKVKPGNDDQRVGVDIVRRALRAPARQIADNAGADGAVVVGKLMESKNANFGFNAQTNSYEDLVKAGIIDPTKVVRTALQDASSVAGLLITTQAMVAEKPVSFMVV
jgi:chaperonin GroEL